MKEKTKGQSLVEFALILPILLLLLLGIIEGARIIWAYITVQNAAREAARYAVTGQPYNDAGNPWTMRADRFSGCNPDLVEGNLVFESCDGPNDRVDAIIGVALAQGRGLVNEDPAIDPSHYDAAGYIDEGGTYGVQVYGQAAVDGTEAVTQLVDYAGTEGLNVLVQVYYNVELLDPLYAAIIPNGFVHLKGEVQMQNEGIDSVLGAAPPAGIEPPQPPPGAPPPPPGQVNAPVVFAPDVSAVDAGSNLNIRLEYHPANKSYDVYLYSISQGYVPICRLVDVGSLGSRDATCLVPAATTPGSYQLVSILAYGDADPDNHVGEGDFVDVLYPGQPLLTIADINRWPPGSTITFQLFGHLPCPEDKSPCPPYQEYDIALIGGPFLSPGQVIPPAVRVDALGSASKTWAIPASLKPGSYTVVTYRRDTITPVIAQTVLEIVPAEIIVQGGNRWPAGSNIRVILRGHAPNRTYRLLWIDGQSGSTQDVGTVTTDKFGNTVAAVQFRIPANTADSPPNHRIVSIEEGGSGAEVASTQVEVFTPKDPLIVVVGGSRWPAGSLIQIELHQHFDGPYNLYFDDKLIEGDVSPNASGFYERTYDIPIDTSDGTHEIRTERVSDDGTEATTEIDVESVPLIGLADGVKVVRPSSVITIELKHHAPNDSYKIYLDGKFLRDIPTGAGGQSFCTERPGGECIYDLKKDLADLEGGPFVLESRQGGRTIASTEIYVIAPDLQITSIQFPEDLLVNVPMPVTVTVRNNSDAAISNEWFDVDLYIDPLHPPTTSSQFPPGDYKRWLDKIRANGTARVVFEVILPGTQHTIYGRVDTSNNVVESNETNNIYKTTIQSDACVRQIANGLNSDTKWTPKAYGNGVTGTSPLADEAITITSNGSDIWGSSDNMYLVYYKPEMIRGDFEVRVRMREGPGDDSGENEWAVAGLEVRNAVDNPSSAKVDLGVANSDHTSPAWQPAVQAIYRDGSGGASRAPGADTDRKVSYPVWLRIVRSGNRFDYYYSDSNSDTPPADGTWTAHGSVRMDDMGPEVAIGFFNAVGYGSDTSVTSVFDNFYICLRSPDAELPGGEDFPPGLTVCTDNLVQNGGFESGLTHWSPTTIPSGWGAVQSTSDGPPHEGGYAVRMRSYRPGHHLQAFLSQDFTMPGWVISPTIDSDTGDTVAGTTIELSFYVCVLDYPGSTAEPEDQLSLELLGGDIIAPTVIPITNGANVSGSACSSYTPYSADLARATIDAGNDLAGLAGDSLSLRFFDTSNDVNDDGTGSCPEATDPSTDGCYETYFFLDSVELKVCTTQPEPPEEADKIYKVGGPLRVFIGGAPQPKQGVRVWAYRENGELLTTYSLQDSNYFFYNLDPDERYTFYAEYWDGPNLYSDSREITLGSAPYVPVPDGEGRLVITNLSLLLR